MSEDPEMQDLLAQAVEQAMTNKSVVVFLSSARLLRMIPEENQDAVRAELERFGSAAYWCLAYVTIDAPIGTWKPYQREDRPDVVWLVINVGDEDYAALPKLLNDGLRAKQEQSILN